MSLLNLSRSTPRANSQDAREITANDFIDEALTYANGQSTDLAMPPLTNQVSCNAIEGDNAQGPMRRATFTLTEESIAQLTELSKQSGTAKSKLIRLWVAHYSRTSQHW